MAFPSVFHNIAGTLKSAFRIGGSTGPSIRQGLNNPNVAGVEGVNGDVFIQNGAEERFFQHRGGYWMNIGGEGFTRTAVTTPSYAIQKYDYYVGVNYYGHSTIYLPPGITNKQFIIKDESGTLDANSTIRIIPAFGETIDGDSELIINASYTSITLVFGNEWHLI